jgi:hypothetical protein
MTNYPAPRQMSNGYWVAPDADGRLHLATCDWLVEVPSGNPEPDSIEDCWTIRPCGARITWFGHEGASFTCEAGHHHESYVATEGRYEAELDLVERFEAGVA